MKRRDSPVSNNGRGLKPVVEQARLRAGPDSPVSNNGRGLKLVIDAQVPEGIEIRPLAITGVD